MTLFICFSIINKRNIYIKRKTRGQVNENIYKVCLPQKSFYFIEVQVPGVWLLRKPRIEEKKEKLEF